MEFFRANYKHLRTAYEQLRPPVRVDGESQSEVTEVTRLEKVDKGAFFFPAAFFRMITHAFCVKHHFVAGSIVRDGSVDEREISAKLRPMLAAYGIFVNVNGFTFQNHGNAMEAIFYYTTMRDGARNLKNDGFSFSTHFAEFCELAEKAELDIVDEEVEVDPNSSFYDKALAGFGRTGKDMNFVILFMTPLGFAYYASPAIDWASFRVFVVVSKTQITEIEWSGMNVTIKAPSHEMVGVDNERPVRTLCDFVMVDEQWQPVYKHDFLAAVGADIVSGGGVAKRDGMTVDLYRIAGTTHIVIGLMGRFRDIVALFEGDEATKRKLMTRETRLIPELFFVMGSGAASYMMLYLPDDYMPNDPQYRAVSQYSYTIMRRCCTVTLLVPNVGPEPEPGRIDNCINGIMSQAVVSDILFFGSTKSQVIAHRTEPHVPKMVFNDIDEFITWMEWIAPRDRNDGRGEGEFKGFNKLNTARNQYREDVFIDAQTIQLIRFHREQSAEAHGFHEILFGKYGDVSPEQLTEMQLQDGSGNCNISIMLDKAMWLSARAKASRPVRCVICGSREKISDDEKLALLKTEKELCEKCVLEQLNNYGGERKESQMAAQRKIIEATEKSKKEYDDVATAFINLVERCRTMEMKHVGLFGSWFLEYWITFCLARNWTTLKQGNQAGLDKFDSVEMDESGQNVENLREAVGIMSGTTYGKDDNRKYYKRLTEIGYYCAEHMGKEEVDAEFREVLLEHNSRRKEALDFTGLSRKCNGLIKKITHWSNNIEVRSVVAMRNMKVEVEGNFGQLVKYVFYRSVHTKSDSLSARPIQGKPIATLIEQPKEMKVVNSWAVNNGVLVLTAVGTRLRLFLLEEGFHGRSTEKVIYKTKIEKDSDCQAEYASTANIIYVALNVDDNHMMVMIQLALDFKSSTEVRRREMRSLQPLMGFRAVENPKEKNGVMIQGPEFHGFIIDETATVGVISVNQTTSSHKTTFISFDPMTLSVVQPRYVIGETDIAIRPLHFLNTKDHGGALVGCSVEGRNENGQMVHQLFLCKSDETIALDLPTVRHGETRSKIGVGEFSGRPIIVVANDKRPPTMQMAYTELPVFPALDSMFSANFDREAIPKFVCSCIRKYGLSELERVCFPGRTAYPVELAKFDVLHISDPDLEDGGVSETVVKIVNAVRSSMSSALPFDWSIPMNVHELSLEKYDLSDLVPNRPHYEGYKGINNFFARLSAIPQLLVRSIPQQETSIRVYAQHIVQSLANTMKSQFPPLAFLRATKPRPCKVISLVDIGSADGSSLLSSLVGLPFTPSTKGTFRAGATYVPIFKEEVSSRYLSDSLTIDPKSIKGFRNFIVNAIRPDHPSSPARCAIALYTAIACSDLVIVNAGKDTELMKSVIARMILVLSGINDIAMLITSRPHVKFAFVTDLGADGTVAVSEFDDLIRAGLETCDCGLQTDVFADDCIYVHSKWTTYEIARSISQNLLMKMVDNWDREEKVDNTETKLAGVYNAAGIFASMLSYADFFLLMDDDDRIEENA